MEGPICCRNNFIDGVLLEISQNALEISQTCLVLLEISKHARACLK